MSIPVNVHMPIKAGYFLKMLRERDSRIVDLEITVSMLMDKVAELSKPKECGNGDQQSDIAG